MKKWLLPGMLALSMNAWAQTTYYIANAIPYADEDKLLKESLGNARGWENRFQLIL